MSQPVFGRTTTAVLVAVVGISFLAWVLVLTQGGGGRLDDELGPTGYDPDPLGHIALVRTLEALDVPVLQSWHDSGRRAGDQGVLMIVEPTLDAGGPRSAALTRAPSPTRR